MGLFQTVKAQGVLLVLEAGFVEAKVLVCVVMVVGLLA